MMMSAARVRPGQGILSQFTAGHVTLIRANRREIEMLPSVFGYFTAIQLKKV